MAINIYSSLRRRNFEDALFGPNGVAGMVFYGALLAGVVSTALGFNLMTLPYILGLLVLPLGFIFFKEVLGKLIEGEEDWKPEKWGEFIVQNFFEMFEVMLSYATNTMSFLRVGAYILVHAGMMMGFLAIAEVMPGGVVGFTIMAFIGNAFVTVVEALLVGIQVLRLNFYELFSRFFQGQGRPYSPVKVSAEN